METMDEKEKQEMSEDRMRNSNNNSRRQWCPKTDVSLYRFTYTQRERKKIKTM